jgi:hypothetical protein
MFNSWAWEDLNPSTEHCIGVICAGDLNSDISSNTGPRSCNEIQTHSLKCREEHSLEMSSAFTFDKYLLTNKMPTNSSLTVCLL